MAIDDEVDLTDYAQINMANWDSRVPFHEAGYELENFDDPTHISTVVQFDLPLLGDIKGLRGIHLQCHIGWHWRVVLAARRRALGQYRCLTAEARRFLVHSRGAPRAVDIVRPTRRRTARH